MCKTIKNNLPTQTKLSKDSLNSNINVKFNSNGKQSKIIRTKEILESTNYFESIQTPEEKYDRKVKAWLVGTSIAVTLIILFASILIIILAGLGTLPCFPEGFLKWFVSGTLGVVISNSVIVYKGYFHG